jgi:hypothetical protein
MFLLNICDGLAEELVLPVYVKNSKRQYSYAKVINPSWNGDFLRFCTALVIDREGNETSVWMYPAGHSYSRVMIKPCELRKIEQIHEEVHNPPKKPEGATVSETPEEYVKYMRKKDEPDDLIAVHLKNKFPDLSAHECMKLIDPRRVELWEQLSIKQGRPKQWFYYLIKKREKELEKLEKL